MYICCLIFNRHQVHLYVYMYTHTQHNTTHTHTHTHRGARDRDCISLHSPTLWFSEETQYCLWPQQCRDYAEICSKRFCSQIQSVFNICTCTHHPYYCCHCNLVCILYSGNIHVHVHVHCTCGCLTTHVRTIDK